MREVPELKEGEKLVRLPLVLNEESGCQEAFCSDCNEVTFRLLFRDPSLTPLETVPHICKERNDK